MNLSKLKGEKLLLQQSLGGTYLFTRLLNFRPIKSQLNSEIKLHLTRLLGKEKNKVLRASKIDCDYKFALAP